MNIHNTLPGYDDLDDVTVHSGIPKPSADSIVAYVAKEWSVRHEVARAWLVEAFGPATEQTKPN